MSSDSTSIAAFLKSFQTEQRNRQNEAHHLSVEDDFSSHISPWSWDNQMSTQQCPVNIFASGHHYVDSDVETSWCSQQDDGGPTNSSSGFFDRTDCRSGFEFPNYPFLPEMPNNVSPNFESKGVSKVSAPVMSDKRTDSGKSLCSRTSQNAKFTTVDQEIPKNQNTSKDQNIPNFLLFPAEPCSQKPPHALTEQFGWSTTPPEQTAPLSVFVGNIPKNTTPEVLHKLMSLKGTVTEVVCDFRPDCWLTAFVTYSKPSEASKAVEFFNNRRAIKSAPPHRLVCCFAPHPPASLCCSPTPTCLPHKIKPGAVPVLPFFPKFGPDRTETGTVRRPPPVPRFSLLKDGPPGANLFTYGIPSDWTEVTLMRLCQEFGHIVGIRVPGAPTSGPQRLNKGFGFVSYDSTDCSARALEALSGRQFLGKPLNIQLKLGEQLPGYNRKHDGSPSNWPQQTHASPDRFLASATNSLSSPSESSDLCATNGRGLIDFSQQRHSISSNNNFFPGLRESVSDTRRTPSPLCRHSTTPCNGIQTPPLPSFPPPRSSDPNGWPLTGSECHNEGTPVTAASPDQQHSSIATSPGDRSDLQLSSHNDEENNRMYNLDSPFLLNSVLGFLSPRAQTRDPFETLHDSLKPANGQLDGGLWNLLENHWSKDVETSNKCEVGKFQKLKNVSSHEDLKALWNYWRRNSESRTTVCEDKGFVNINDMWQCHLSDPMLFGTPVEPELQFL